MPGIRGQRLHTFVRDVGRDPVCRDQGAVGMIRFHSLFQVSAFLIKIS